MIELIRHTTKSGKQSPFWLVVIDGLESFKVASLDCAKRLMQKFTNSEEHYEDVREVETVRVRERSTERNHQTAREEIEERNRICYPMSATTAGFGYRTRSFQKSKLSITITNKKIRKHDWFDTVEKNIQPNTQYDKMGQSQSAVSHQSFVGNAGEFYNPRTSVGSDSTNRSLGEEYTIFSQSTGTNYDNKSTIRLRTSQTIEISEPEKGQQDKTTLLADRSTIAGIFERIHDESTNQRGCVTKIDGAYRELNGAYRELNGAYRELNGACKELRNSVDTYVIKPLTKLFYAIGGTPEQIGGASGTRKPTTSFDLPQRNITTSTVIF